MIHRGVEQHGTLSVDCDDVVVGSGASGAVVAALLAEAGRRVVILEEGRHVPALEHGAMRRSESLRYLWRGGGMAAAIGVGDSPMVNVHIGRGVGGSSSLTGGVCFRTPDEVLHRWVTEHGLSELSPEKLAPCFDEVEKAIHVEEVPVQMRSRSTAVFGRGLEVLGARLESMRRNTRGCNGCSRCNFGCPHGAKLSVDLTYIPRALAAGAELFSDCLVESVDTSGDRAVGVSGRLLNGPRRAPGDAFDVRARRVLLACGAAYTPLLLLKSGLAGRSKQVGRNLTLHPSLRCFARFDERIDGWKGSLQSAFSDSYAADGVTLNSIFVPPAVFAAQIPGAGAAHKEQLAVLPHLAMFGALVHDDGGGRIRRGLGREPLMTYRLSKRDRARVNFAVRKMAEVFFAAGAREVYLPILGSHPLDADAFRKLDVERVPGRMLECASQHPLGTTRMGTSPDRSVVDPTGALWGMRGVYVVDGGIHPTSLGVNPQITIMAVATRLAHALRQAQ